MLFEVPVVELEFPCEELSVASSSADELSSGVWVFEEVVSDEVSVS